MFNRNTGKNVAEFFAGIGLMRAGLEKANWNITFANDIDPVKKRLYLNHFSNSKEHFILEDIHNLTGALIPETALATASFPCTDLSLAGGRAGLDGANSSAFWGFVDILKEMEDKKPPIILLENVTGFLTSNEGKDFTNALLALNAIGYSVDTFIVNAIHFVPQSRVRLFIIGKLANNIPHDSLLVRQYFPETQVRPKKIVDFIFNHPEINWSINHKLPDLPILRQSLPNIVQKLSKTSDLWWSDERVTYLLNQTSNLHLEKLMSLRNEKRYHYLTAFRRKRNGRSMAEIRFDGIAGCLRTPKGGSARQILIQIGKGEINVRLLTPKECARLMGADDFKLSGTANESLFGFGDAVCVPVITWIAENYLNQIFEEITSEQNIPLETEEKYARPA
jgi:DNA (cytosine-5)-methyltransferase 1